MFIRYQIFMLLLNCPFYFNCPFTCFLVLVALDQTCHFVWWKELICEKYQPASQHHRHHPYISPPVEQNSFPMQCNERWPSCRLIPLFTIPYYGVKLIQINAFLFFVSNNLHLGIVSLPPIRLYFCKDLEQLWWIIIIVLEFCGFFTLTHSTHYIINILTLNVGTQ